MTRHNHLKNISLWQPSIRHRPADVLSNTHSQLSAVSHPGGVKWKICGKIAIGYGNGKKQFSFSVIERFFSPPDWRCSFHSPYILKGKSIFCDGLECVYPTYNNRTLGNLQTDGKWSKIPLNLTCIKHDEGKV